MSQTNSGVKQQMAATIVPARLNRNNRRDIGRTLLKPDDIIPPAPIIDKTAV